MRELWQMEAFCFHTKGFSFVEYLISYQIADLSRAVEAVVIDNPLRYFDFISTTKQRKR